VREGVVRGYFNADGYPNFSKARNQVSLKATTVNKIGADSMRRLLATIGYKSGVYMRYKEDEVWELCIARQEDVVDFYKCIGFSIRRKQNKLRTMLVRKGLLS
jgi:intein-encoded DNA endonuclease-like protein